MKDNSIVMGGCCCCCASNISDLNRSPPYFHHPVSEEHEPLSSHHETVSALSTGLLVDTNLDTSVPVTYRPPLTPIPYESHLSHLPTPSRNQEGSGHKSETALGTTDREPVEEINDGNTLEKKNSQSDENTEMVIDQEASKGMEDEMSDEPKKGSKLLPQLQDEEDTCPICLEEYDAENPKILTKCVHHFHLACILEWMERSDTCAMCDQEMVINHALGE